MNRLKTITVLWFAVAAMLTGCEGQSSQWTDSGIRKALDTDALMRTAGAPQGIELAESDSSESGRTGYSVESKRRFYATITSGTRGQLLAAYRDEVKREIERNQGQIHSTTSAIQRGGTGGEVHDFGFGYSWGGNEGIVRAYSFPARPSAGIKGEVEVVMLCYEYAK